MNKLNNKIALITGGSSGIGLATAKMLYAEGATIIITGRDEAKLTAARQQIGGNTLAIAGDASNIKDITTLMDTIATTFGHIDILFANAGMSECPPLLETDEAFFDHIMNVNVKGVFFTFTKAMPLLAANASVILTSSVAHSKGRPGDPLYTATKAAVRSLGRTLAMDEDVLDKNIRVNIVSPGPIQTPLTQQDTPEMQEAINTYIKDAVPMKRWGQADEVAKAVLYLASADSSYMTGGEITVDGGMGAL